MTWLSSLLNTDESSFEIYFVTEIQTPYKNWRLVTCRFRTSRACLIFHLWRHLGSCRLRTHRVVLACSATTWHTPSIISQCCPSSTCRTCLPRQIKTSPRYYLFVLGRWGFPWGFPVLYFAHFFCSPWWKWDFFAKFLWPYTISVTSWQESLAAPHSFSIHQDSCIGEEASLSLHWLFDASTQMTRMSQKV